MRWSNFFHIYQPPAWNEDIIRRVTTEAYQPLLDILERHPKLNITLNITGSLIEPTPRRDPRRWPWPRDVNSRERRCSSHGDATRR